MRAIILAVCCAASFWGGIIVRQPPVERVAYQSVYLPMTVLPFKETRYANEQIDRIAASIPATALKMVSK